MRTRTTVAAAALLTVGVLLGWAVSHAQPQKAATSPPTATKKTQIGDLHYEAGFPTPDTVKKLYDEMDFQRAVLAYQYVDTLVSLYSMNVAFKAAGADDGDLVLWQRFLDPKTIALTGNNTTIYALGFLDLDKAGPMVLDVTPGPVYGGLWDLWQVPIGAITEKGGTFVVATDDFKGPVPTGATLIKSRTKLASLVIRGLVRNDDVAAAAHAVEITKVYPLAKIASPPRNKVIHATGKTMDTISPEGMPFWVVS